MAAVLTTKVMSMPMDTGKSMLTRRCTKSRQALPKNGPHEKNITGKLSTQDAQRKSCTMSGVMSPSIATYEG